MDAKRIGSVIRTLRVRKGLTQAALAEQIGVTGKAVSRWESGQGYPDITLLPPLAAVLGCRIDYLLLGEDRGIAVAGNMIVDVVKNIDCYPERGMLAQLSEITQAVGGCAPNTAIDLARIDRTLPVSAIGKVGMDEEGRYILSTLQRNGVNVEGVVLSEHERTSFCDVMSLPGGERTFFHKKGANAEFSPEDVNIDGLFCDILHIGYLMLLDKFDVRDEKYGTRMARFLHEVGKRGIKTSIDMISKDAPEYSERVLPALRYCDYVIVNEIEATRVFSLSPRTPDGTLHIENIRRAMEKMAEAGVRERVIVHAKEASFLLNVGSGEWISVPSLDIPPELILGTVGAGDAFSAGCLYGIYRGFADKRLLEFASAAAACNLFAANSIDGMRSAEEIFEVEKRYPRKSK